MQEYGLLPSVDSNSYFTGEGVGYLKEPGVAMISAPHTDTHGMHHFLDGFSHELKFDDYLDDPVQLTNSEELIKTAGQLCYASWSDKRTWNKDCTKYIQNILSSGHGSVLEHANFSFLLYGISRSLSHELVRHRVGVGVSQVSQRYVNGRVLRFVERPEYQKEPYLHGRFIGRINHSAKEYAEITEYLLKQQTEGSSAILSADAKTDLRKKIQQAARSVLPNETEAPMIMTGNVRAWRHILEMRCSAHAEVEIRELAYRLYQCLVQIEPILFGDYEVIDLTDGTKALKTNYEKV